MLQSYGFDKTISNEQANINKYAGTKAKNIGIAITEYGVNAHSYPVNQVNYHRSQDLALFVANALRIIINNHIPIAEKHYLISYQNSPAPGVQTYVNSNLFSNNSLLAGPGPNSYMQPSAYVFQAYTKLLYSNLLSSSIKNNPKEVFSSGSYPALATIATTDKHGNEAIMILNLSGTQNIKAQISPSYNNYTKVNSWSLGSNSYLAYNSLSDSSVVSFIEKSSNLYNGKLASTFPAGSITILRFSK
jgi:hypothetical protein